MVFDSRDNVSAANQATLHFLGFLKGSCQARDDDEYSRLLGWTGSGIMLQPDKYSTVTRKQSHQHFSLVGSQPRSLNADDPS
jgi:hypothetical protein